jgi:hypothetical protein
VIGQKHPYEGKKAFSKGRKPGLFVNFGQLPDPDPDPGRLKQCGSEPGSAAQAL